MIYISQYGISLRNKLYQGWILTLLLRDSNSFSHKNSLYYITINDKLPRHLVTLSHFNVLEFFIIRNNAL